MGAGLAVVYGQVRITNSPILTKKSVNFPPHIPGHVRVPDHPDQAVHLLQRRLQRLRAVGLGRRRGVGRLRLLPRIRRWGKTQTMWQSNCHVTLASQTIYRFRQRLFVVRGVRPAWEASLQRVPHTLPASAPHLRAGKATFHKSNF